MKGNDESVEEDDGNQTGPTHTCAGFFSSSLRETDGVIAKRLATPQNPKTA
jgi:hypothetical protein